MHENAHTNAPLARVLQELRAAAGRPFDRATPIPASVNHSREFLECELRSIFMREWICIGRWDEIAGHGDYLTHAIAGVPILAVRQADLSIRAFVNACAHRFACLVPAQKGTAKRFSCRYHAWTYDTAGQLIRAPWMEMKPGFDCAQHRLRELQVGTWEGFVYVSLADEPLAPPGSVLASFSNEVVGRYDMACYKTVLRESMSWQANWKNLVENFTESYHVPIAHGKTFARHDKALQDYVCGEDSEYYCYHRAPQTADSGPGAAHPDNTRLGGEWRRMMVDFCVFPCLLVTLMPDYLWYISVQPQGTDAMLATWGLAVPPEVLADVKDEDFEHWLARFRDYLEIANDEDKTLVEALHRGTMSPLLPVGTYHPIERNLWQFTNYLARLCQPPA